jgi:two-component system cell cycle sensor histidine kinase/response regulator CckA
LAQRMEAIGQLAGGVAHDFNNLLSVIIGYGDILLERVGSDDQMRHHCEEILKAGNRAASLTRQLLAYSRQQVLQPKVLDLNAVVREIEKMLRRVIGEDIELKTFLDPALGSVKADPGQLERIVLNLAVNARDAMPDGGELTIQTTEMFADAEFARTHRPMFVGKYVVLDITDTGIGMDDETQAHIFEPFFTTKEPGKGTGLGLATVYGVVKQSGGYIWVYSEPGLGTTFKIYLPRVDEPASLSAPAEPSLVFPQHSETVLLAEDDQSIRRLTRTLLEQGGFHVLEAARGDDALDMAVLHEGPIHILLTDIIMPGINGTELAKRVLRERPEVKPIFMSGYTGFRQRDVLGAGALLLAKPFTRDALFQKLQEALLLEENALAK